MFRLNNVVKRFVSGDVETTAIARVSLTIARGEYVAVTGPSGCGKSTLLSLLGLLDIPDEGTLEFGGAIVSSESEAALARLRAGRIGFIFQSFNLISHLSVRDNVSLPLKYMGVARHERDKRSAEILERLGLAHRSEHRPVALSGGQQQRVAIARALISKPEVLLADEPTGNLDSAHGKEVMSLISQAHTDGATIVMVTHSNAHASVADRIVSMRDGSVSSPGGAPSVAERIDP